MKYQKPQSINKITFTQKMKSYKSDPLSFILLILVCISACVTIFIIVVIIGYIIVKGLPEISPELFEWEYNSDNVSMMPAIINTVNMTLFSLAMAVPAGVFSAIYLVEYAKKGNKLVSIIRITTETLAGIPSIVYGLFGYLMFVIACKLGNSMLSGALTMSIMVLPTIIRTTEESLMSVPDSFREGSFGLGAGRLRTVFRIVIPAAVPGILSGIILSTGRIVGETAALIYTSGTIAGIPENLMDSGRTLSVHMYALLSEGVYTEQAYATAVVLLVMVAGINTLSNIIAKKISVRY